MRIALVSDPHIKNRTWQNFPDLCRDAEFASSIMVRNLSDQPYEDSVLILAGDLFDSTRPSSMDCQVARRLLDSRASVYYIEGNHEQQPGIGWASVLSDRAVPLSPSYWCPLADDVAIVGANYTRSSEIPEMLEDLRSQFKDIGSSRRIICVIHQAVDAMIGIPGVFTVTLDQLRECSRGFHVSWVCGHVHENKLIEDEDGSFQFYSPGSLYPTSFPETRQFHGYTEIDVVKDGDGPPRLVFDRKPVEVRTYDRIVASTRDEVLEKAESMFNADKAHMSSDKLVPYLRVVPAEGVDPASLMAKPRHECLIHVVRDVTESSEDAGPHTGAQAISFVDAVREECGDAGDVLDVSEFLLGSSDPIKDLHKIIGILLNREKND